MKKLAKKILDFVFNPRHEALILLGLPLLAILIAFVILIPQLQDFYYTARSASYLKNAQYSVTEIPESSAVPQNPAANPPAATPIPTTDLNLIHVSLTAQSIEKDLYVFVRDASGVPVQGKVFPLFFTYPNGQTAYFNTETDGSCYLTNLNPGSYSVSMQEMDGYATAAPITAQVKDAVNYTKIENIEEIVEIRDLTEGLNEIKTNGDVQSHAETVIEYITSENPDHLPEDLTEQYVYDANGHLTYQYEYFYDDDGFLLLRTGESTDVIPNVEDGILVCGLRYNEVISAYETVELFHEDNTPLEEYMINATPITRQYEHLAGWQNENGALVYYSNGQKLAGLKNIDGKLYWFDNSGVRANSVGIDVSFYNGNINWNAVRNAGIDFVIIRAGFRGWGSASMYQDTCFRQNLLGAKEAGLKVGVYFYSTAVNRVEAVEEASLVLDWLGGTSLDCPVYIDMEYSGDYPNGRQDLLSPAVRVEVARAFCETIRNSGYTPGVYATQSYFKTELDFNSVAEYNIWLASFTEFNELPNFQNRFDMWQFTDYGRVAGVSGTVDFNVIR